MSYRTRTISRSRKQIEALNPCVDFSQGSGKNPFAYLLNGLQSALNKKEKTDDERKIEHQVKMSTEQKSARSRQLRKKNKI